MANEFKHKTVGTVLTQAEWEQTDGTGHQLDSQATGDIVYASSATVLSRLGVGTNGDLLNLGSGIPAWTSAISTAKTVADDILLGLGTGADGVLLNRSTVLNANTALTGVMIGTPVTPAVAANSLLISNVTASGDYLLALNNGGNSQAWQWVDASGGTQTLYAAGVARVLLNSTGGSFTGTWSNLGTVTTVDINGGSIDGAAIGAASHSTIKGTTIDATTDFTIGDTVITDGVITDSTGLSLEGGLVVNEDSANVDFRVEGNGNANMLFVDAGLDNITIGGAADGRYFMAVSGSYTPSSGNKAYAFRLDSPLTGISGDTASLAGASFNGSITTQAVSESVADVTQAIFAEPTITKGSGNTITRASTILIAGIPSEGTTDYGLMIDGGASDAHYIGLASSDIDTGLTTGPLLQDVAVDDFFTLSKLDPGQGGVLMQAISESASNVTFFLDAIGGTPITGDTAGPYGWGVISLWAGEHDNSNAFVDMADTSNIFTVGEIAAGDPPDAEDRVTRLLLKANGVLHLTNIQPVALDAEDDVQLVRAMQLEGSDGTGIIESEYDNPFYSYAKLVELGLAGEKNKKGIFLFPLQKRLHAHEGAIWQTYIRVRDLEEKLEIAERKLVALGA